MDREAELSTIRNRGLKVLRAGLWIGAAAFTILVGNAYLSAIQRVLELANQTRRSAGLAAPVQGPDWLALAIIAFSALLPLAILAALYLAHNRAWRRRVRLVWERPGDLRVHSRICRLEEVADPAQVPGRLGYLQALLRAPLWADRVQDAAVHPDADPVTEYKRLSGEVLRHLEVDIAKRALTAGLIVGASRYRAIDLLTIASAAFELQLHVVANLGKRPNLRIWRELLKRTGASLFVNAYLTRQDAWELALLVKKTAMGVAVLADASDHAADWIDQLDPDEYLDMLPDDGWAKAIKTAAEVGLSSTGFAMGVGAEGGKQISRLIDQYGESIAEGVIAGGVLYHHGLAIAAECLALDRQHRSSADFNRSVLDTSTRLAGAVGKLLFELVQEFRSVLKAKRRQLARAAFDKAKTASQGLWPRAPRREPPKPSVEPKGESARPGSSEATPEGVSPTPPSGPRSWWRRGMRTE